jgi:hypothetical protein
MSGAAAEPKTGAQSWAHRGGGEQAVGTPGKSMELVSFDEKTRPITRQDLFNFLMDEKNTSDYEKSILIDAAKYGVTGTVAGFIGGYAVSSLLPWRWLEKRAVRPFPGFAKFGRITFGMCGASIPFFMVQQWTTDRFLELDEMKSVLAFHVKRLLITQRSSLLFTRSQVREVTKEEQKKLAQQNVTIRQQDSVAAGGRGTSVDINLAMQQQVLTPVAQTGYKKM